ncbi:MAG: hypothetical protein ABFC85_07030 [Rectinema sp.]
MNGKPTIADLQRFVTSTPCEKDFAKTAQEFIAFMDSLPSYVPTKRDEMRARIKAARHKVLYAVAYMLEELARKARYAA